MANPQRGEITAELDGRQWTLCLTLGALAELEEHFGAGGLADLAARISGKPLAARDLIAILAAALKGGGHDLSAGDVAELRHADGPAGMALVVARLLEATFTPPGTDGHYA